MSSTEKGRPAMMKPWYILPLALVLSAVAAAAAPADPNPATIHSNRGAWPLYRQWNPAETHHFAAWIEHIYDKKCNGTPRQRLAKLERILTDPAMNLLLDPAFAGHPVNPQLDRASMHAMHAVLDCGKLTESLAMYYAYRRGLPWMVSHVRSGDGRDIRTSSFNVPVGSSSSFHYSSADAFCVDTVHGFCTGNFRIVPCAATSGLSDTVPIAIDRRYLQPGCLYYMDGHVMVVGKIDQFGEVYFLDSTTAPSREIYSHEGLNAANGIIPKGPAGSPNEFAGCFRGFLTFRFPIAEVDKNGLVLRVRRRTDAEMKAFGFSTEQYAKMTELENTGHIKDHGLTADTFHGFIRMRLRTAQHINPSKIIENYADQMLAMFRTREQLVQAAWHEVQKNGPIVFPEGRLTQNIFNDQGRWGKWSTAALDVDYRARYRYLLNWIDSAVQWYANTPGYVDLASLNKAAIVNKADLAYALIQEKKRIFSNKIMYYTNSAGKKVPLTLLQIEHRLYDLSFDPNQPPELRWGAHPGSPEARSAPEMSTPLPDGTRVPMAEAYRREAFYRTLSHRDTDESYLRNMFTHGFPVPAKFNDNLALWLKVGASPPLVPTRG